MIERLWYAVTRPRAYDDGDALASIGVNLFSNAVGLLTARVLPMALYFVACERWRRFGAPMTWWVWRFVFLAADLEGLPGTASNSLTR